MPKMGEGKTIGMPIAMLVLGDDLGSREVGYGVRWNTGQYEFVWCEKLSRAEKQAARQAALPEGLPFSRVGG